MEKCPCLDKALKRKKYLWNLFNDFNGFVSGNKSPKKKGKSKRAHVLVAAVERATANFVDRGNQVS